ncbi:hypothetical protein Q0Z83_032700 [Actinoplanes sichuanensis]|uniref:Uncharacterized protein n=1 Tax=Actinoplanes sichuanensis TaxID=512349 RepID=A0ABW4A657_9ACTN|nr:hypothetical protein [Actinoplanes sichuanensis]BEL05079.1 hypothetical protein Q0Z83_032700 [Actinoplanes sichuanensis]
MRVAVALVAVLALTGCTGQSARQRLFDDAVISGDAAVLGDAVAAFFVGPVVKGPTEHGYLVLVGPGGAFRTIRTAPMDSMRPAWSPHGLYFADEDNDYRLTASGLTVTANPKTAAQNLMFALPGGGAVGVFNNAGDQISTPDGRLYQVSGTHFTGADCDGRIYGIGGDAYRETLTAIYPAEREIAQRPATATEPIGQVPCVDGVVTYLSWAGVVSWNTTTGDHQVRPLTVDDGTRLDEQDFGYAVQDWKDGRLHWVYADGRVFATDPATGRTTPLFDTGLGTGFGRERHTLYAFTGTALHTISTLRDAPGNLGYTVFDRADGRKLREAEIAIPNTAVNVGDLGLTYMAARD